MPSSAVAATSVPIRPLVVADMGGTNARFGWVERVGQVPDHVQTLPTAEFAGPCQAMGQ